MKTFFVDFEASSLEHGSFPIEVAWVDNNGEGESYLIRPEPTWTDWSAKSEDLHHISRAMLQAEGLPAARVAKRVLAALGGHLVVSDQPAFDNHWMAVLLDVIGKPQAVAIHHLQSLLENEARRLAASAKGDPSSPAYLRAYADLMVEGRFMLANAVVNQAAERRDRHRALPDAIHMWATFRKLRVAIDQRLTSSDP